MLISASGNNVTNAVAKARSVAGLKIKDTRETCRSGGEDNLWRVSLNGGHVVEVTTIQHAPCEAHVVSEEYCT